MRQKWRSVLSATLIFGGLAMISCTSEDLGGKKPVDKETPTGDVEGYFSFTLTTHPEAYATRSDLDASGTKEENVVESSWAVFYDGNGISRYQVDLGQSNGDGATAFDQQTSATNTAVKFTMKALKLERKDYDMLVMLNPTDALKAATAVGQRVSDLETALEGVPTDVAESGTGSSYTKILMTNANGLTRINATDFKDNEADAETAGAAIVVKVDRILSKVAFMRSASIQYPNGGSLALTGTYSPKWSLDITNKKTYWLRKGTYTSTGVMELPSMDRKNLYAIDPNYDGNSKLRTIYPLRDFEEVDDFNYITEADITKPFNAANGTGANAPNWSYAFENTMSADEQWEDVTTRVLLKASFMPTGFSAGASYFYFRGAAFTHAQLKNMHQNEATNPYPNNPQGLKEAVRLAIADGLSMTTAPTASRSYNGGLKYYQNGVSYYSVLIRHFGGDLGEMAYGKYGIVRNNLYKVTLNAINGPGEPEYPKPNGPDDDEEYISASVEILPWVVRDQYPEF